MGALGMTIWRILGEIWANMAFRRPGAGPFYPESHFEFWTGGVLWIDEARQEFSIGSLVVAIECRFGEK
jgi:hypothetical protein